MIAFAPCEHTNNVKAGKTNCGTQRFKCKDCGSRFIEEKPLGSMKIDINKAAMALGLMLEGMSVRATERLTGLARDTICDLILVAGERRERFFEEHVVNVKSFDIQCDEIWSFCGMKQKQATARKAGPEVGDSWTHIAVDRDTKMILAHHVGPRDGRHTDRFLNKLATAVDRSNPIQVSTDGWNGYQYGVPFAMGSNIDFGMLIKKYAASQTETRYSPATIMSAEKVPMFGNPNEDKICTSHIESLNQKIRMHLRRFTRLTAAHSKSLDHHIAMQNVFFCWYNFCRKHSTIGKTPAMECGLCVRRLEIAELLASQQDPPLRGCEVLG